MDWPLMKEAVTDDDRKILSNFLCDGNRLTKGEETLKFEKAWSQWLDVKHSLFVSSGSTANLLLVAAAKEKFGWPDGSRVLVPACTWSTNICPIIQCNLVPVFCDIDTKTFSFDTSVIYGGIVAVFVTHLLGIVAPVKKIRQTYPHAIILEDVCESHGAVNGDGTKVGSDTTGSTFSFYYGHHMSTIEGGMVSTNDTHLYEVMRMKRSHGMSREIENKENRENIERMHPDIDNRFLFLTDGYNFRSNDLFAVLGLSQLKRLDNNIKIRRRNFTLFHYIVTSRSDLFLPLWKCKGNSSFCLPFICIKKSTCDMLKKHLEDLGIETRPIVGGNLLRQPAFSKYGNHESFPNADIVHTNGFYIGNSQFVTEEDMHNLKSIIINFEVI